jgi:hypothetical protein
MLGSGTTGTNGTRNVRRRFGSLTRRIMIPMQTSRRITPEWAARNRLAQGHGLACNDALSDF